MLGALLDDAGPAGLVGLLAPSLRRLAFEPDHLDAGGFLPLRLGRVLLRDVGVVRLERLAGPRQHGPLLVREAVPFALVDDDRDLGRVEARVDPVFRLLLPAEVEDAVDRPAISVDDAALERGVDLARRGLDDRRAERLEEVAINRRDADLEPGQVWSGDRLVEVEVEGGVVDHAGQEMRAHPLVVELLHVVEAAVPAPSTPTSSRRRLPGRRWCRRRR